MKRSASLLAAETEYGSFGLSYVRTTKQVVRFKGAGRESQGEIVDVLFVNHDYPGI